MRGYGYKDTVTAANPEDAATLFMKKNKKG
jgi:hypothetical protein